MNIASLFVVLTIFPLYAHGADMATASWKTFKNDNGYQLKHPACWEIIADGDESDDPVREVNELAFKETASCSRSKTPVNKPKGVFLRAGQELYDTKEEVDEELALWRKLDKLQTFSQVSSVGSARAISYIYTNGLIDGQLRWNIKMFCPTMTIEVTGLMDPPSDPAYFNKFKKGYESLPEPEKSIIESIRCIPPNKKMTGVEVFEQEVPVLPAATQSNVFAFTSEAKPTEPVKLNSTRQSEHQDLEFTTQKVAVIVSGPYKGAELILMKYTSNYNGMCGSPLECKTRGFYRFLKFGKQFIFLKKSSVGDPALSTIELREYLKKRGLTLARDENVRATGIFNEKEIIFDEDPRKKLTLLFETDQIDLSHYQFFRKHPTAGDVFQIKTTESEQIGLLNYGAVDTYGMRTNSLYLVKNQDKTFSIYGYSPDILDSKFRISKQLPYGYDRQFSPICEEPRPRGLIDILADQNLSEKTLKLAAKTENGDSLYLPTEKMVQDLYSFYQSTKSEYTWTEPLDDGSESYEEQEKRFKAEEPRSIEEFKKMNPLVLWRNPFGLWMGFVRHRFLMPRLCG